MDSSQNGAGARSELGYVGGAWDQSCFLVGSWTPLGNSQDCFCTNHVQSFRLASACVQYVHADGQKAEDLHRERWRFS